MPKHRKQPARRNAHTADVFVEERLADRNLLFGGISRQGVRVEPVPFKFNEMPLLARDDHFGRIDGLNLIAL